MSEQLTDWFPGDVKPVRPGVYQRDFNFGPTYSKWDGDKWMGYCGTLFRALIETDVSAYQNKPWRGLAYDPNQSTDDSQTDDHTGICEVTE